MADALRHADVVVVHHHQQAVARADAGDGVVARADRVHLDRAGPGPRAAVVAAGGVEQHPVRFLGTLRVVLRGGVADQQTDLAVGLLEQHRLPERDEFAAELGRLFADLRPRQCLDRFAPRPRLAAVGAEQHAGVARVARFALLLDLRQAAREHHHALAGEQAVVGREPDDLARERRRRGGHLAVVPTHAVGGGGDVGLAGVVVAPRAEQRLVALVDEDRLPLVVASRRDSPPPRRG